MSELDGVTVRRVMWLYWTATDRYSYPSFPGGPMIMGHGRTARGAVRDLHRRRARLQRHVGES